MENLKFSLFLSLKALDSILRSRTYRGILIEQDVRIYLDSTKKELINYLNAHDDNFISNFLRRQCKAELFFAKSLIAELLGAPVNLCDYPYSVFVLNISSSVAKKLREGYGVLCFSDGVIPRFPQLRYSKTVFCKKEDSAHSWGSILSDLSAFPRNTLLVIDRYLIKETDEHSVSALKKNLGEIMRALLPQNNPSRTMTVVILFDAVDESWTHVFKNPPSDCDEKTVHEDYYNAAQEQFEERARIINDIVTSKSKGREGYKVRTICVSVVRDLKKQGKGYTVRTWVPGWDYTHNRRILSDYHIVTAEQGFLSFKENGQTEKAQSIALRGLYSEGLTDSSDLVLLRHSYELNGFVKLIDDSLNYLFIAENGVVIEHNKKELVSSIPIFCGIS